MVRRTEELPKGADPTPDDQVAKLKELVIAHYKKRCNASEHFIIGEEEKEVRTHE